MLEALGRIAARGWQPEATTDVVEWVLVRGDLWRKEDGGDGRRYWVARGTTVVLPGSGGDVGGGGTRRQAVVAWCQHGEEEKKGRGEGSS